jgi:hypothetical protein
MYEMFEKLPDYSLKTAVAVSKIDYVSITRAFKNIKVIQQSYMLESFSTCTDRNNFAFKVTDYVMTYMFQGGITQHLYKYVVKTFFPEEESGPSVLSLEDLDFGFIIWLIACAIAIFVFLMEIFWYFMSVKLPLILRCIALLFVLRNEPEKIMKLY